MTDPPPSSPFSSRHAAWWRAIRAWQAQKDWSAKNYWPAREDWLPQRRPPWWPADEPWPPQHRPRRHAWRQWRSSFIWRVAALFFMLLVFSFGGCVLTLGLMANGLGLLHVPGSDLIVSRTVSFSVLLLGLLGFFFTGRALRRLTVSVGDLMEAAGRVEAGDYSTRVPERGPREMQALAHAFNTMAARLEQDAEQRRNLLADVTHELRTPLTVIQGNLEGLLDGIYPSDPAHVTPILEETHVLARLIDDLRTLSQAEGGTLQLQKELTDLGVLANEALTAFRAQAEAAGVTLRAHIADDLPLAEIDPGRIREVLSNLVANALRYTPPGGQITLAGEHDAARHLALLSVSDTGQGIAPDLLPHVFDRFYKSADSRGTGLGLAIAKNLVTAHGGEITAESEPGRGTTLRFTLPL